MIVLSQRYFGSIARCKCGAVIGYKPEDVNRAQVIRCPVCTDLIEVLFDPTYDGKEESRNGETVVSEQ